MPKYKNTPQNRELGRVGKTYNSRGRSNKRKTNTRRRKRTTYKNNAQNKKLRRVGQKYANNRRSNTGWFW